MNHFKKKNNKLEKLRGIFFQIGLIIAGGLTLLAFEWTSPIYEIDLPEGPTVIEPPIELPPVTFQDEAPEKPKVKFIKPPAFDPDKIDIIDKSPTDKDAKTDIDPEVPEFDPGEFAPPEPPEPPTIFTIVEKMPEFVGGNKARIKYLSKNLKYPKMERSAGIEGTVYLKFLVNKKGEIKKVKILRGVSDAIDKEAIRVVKAMPNWSPGKQRGKPVNVSFNFRITFQLN